MTKLNKLIKNLNIIKFSRISSIIMLIAITISIFAQTFLFIEIKKLVDKKVKLEVGYESLLKFKYQTELFLTSYDLENNKKHLYQSYLEFQNGFKILNKTVYLNDSMLNYYEIILNKFNDLQDIIYKNELFNEKNMMNKAILIRIGEINRSEENTDFFILIKSFYEKIEHFKQYQNFLLEDISEIKNDIYKNSDKEIKYLNILFIILPIIILLIASLLSYIIDRAIRDKEKDLVNTKSLLENILNSIPIRVFWKDLDGKYLGANKLFVKDTQFESKEFLIGKTDFELPWSEFEANEYVEDDKLVINSKKPKMNIVETQTTSDGSITHLNTSKVPLFNQKGELFGTLGVYEDITNRINDQNLIKAQEMQIVQQNRLAQMGEMIAMIAHQWRQPLTVISTIIGSLQLKIRKDIFEKDVFDDKFQKVILQTKYLSETIEDFRNFFKPDKTKSKIYSKKLVEDTLNIIEPTLKKDNINVVKNFVCQQELETYTNEVRQVLLNIIKNSSDALIETKTVDPYIKIETYYDIDRKCTISIEDNGGGIPDGIIDKVFDPYFSTKDKNGTGLGLYMSKLIIEDHCEGELSVSSNSQGTIFTIII